jgi:spore coat polysaccharide biosynthesis predicted glycosyltransferase SpsG
MVVIGDQYVNALLTGQGLNYQVISDDVVVSQILDEFQPHVVVFDLMHFPEPVFQAVRKQAMTVSLSPIFNCLAQTDLFFHRTVQRSVEWNFSEQNPVLRCGLEYAVVREDCVRIPEDAYRYNLEQNPLSVVISMGGADASNKTLQALNTLRSVPTPMLFWVLLGEGYAHSYQALVDCIQEDARHEIILAKTNNSMWRIMRMCTLAILGGGTITYEAAYAGLPSINVFEVGEHVFLVKELVEKGVCLNAGYPLADAINVVKANVARLERSRDELLAMHQKCKLLIDGFGARRIAEEVATIYWEDFCQNNRVCASSR